MTLHSLITFTLCSTSPHLASLIVFCTRRHIPLCATKPTSTKLFLQSFEFLFRDSDSSAFFFHTFTTWDLPFLKRLHHFPFLWVNCTLALTQEFCSSAHPREIQTFPAPNQHVSLFTSICFANRAHQRAYFLHLSIV